MGVERRSNSSCNHRLRAAAGLLSWLGDLLSVIYCAKLPEPLHGALSTRETVYSTLVVITCHVGFKLADGRTSKSVFCLHSTVWNDTVSDCHGLFSAQFIKVQLGSVVVRVLDLRSTGRGFDSRPPQCRVATLDKSFTRMCLHKCD